MPLSEFVQQSVFYEVTALLVLAVTVGLLGLLLRQPLIVSFICVGLIAGPSGLDVVHSNDHIDLLSNIGIAILLFLVGIRLDVKLIRSLGAVSLMTGLGQVVFTSIIGYFIGISLGLGVLPSIYIAVALTFSSTIIIVKLLSDKREIDSLHGKIALGFLIVQDLVVVLAMVALSTLGIGTAGAAGGADIIRALISGVAVLFSVFVFVRYLANPLTDWLARSPELLICFAIALAALFAVVGDALGFGKELGGLLAGVSLASTHYREAIAARLAPLRDFLLLFFFIALGARLDLGHLGAGMGAAIIFSLFVLIGNPAIVLAIMGAMGYRKRTSFLAGLTVAQISEFSLVFAGMGVGLGHVGFDVLGLVTLVGLVTIAVSTYMITYSHRLYAWCEPILGIFERPGTPREPQEGAVTHIPAFDVIVFGLGRFGGAVAQRLVRRGRRVLGIDFNPEVVGRWRQLGLAVEFGDATDPEFIASLPLGGVRWAVVSIPQHDTGVTHHDAGSTIVHSLRERDFPGRIAVVRLHGGDSARHGVSSADLILEPLQDGAERAAELLLDEVEPAAPSPQLEEQKQLDP